jgi:hypothetical protein
MSLGQANHFTITILVGLNGVEKGSINRDPEFHASWNPQNVEASARRSRAFVLDLVLVRIVDALDTYMSWSVRKPATVQDTGFRSAIDGAGLSVWNKLEVFCEHVQVDPVISALMFLGIAWRNRRVHSLAENKITKEQRTILISNEEEISRQYKGLKVKLLIDHLEDGSNPTFKEAAGLINVTHKLLEYFDRQL